MSVVGWLFLCGGLWLLVHPYSGIDHDTRLYALMAANWLAPENYARDPWFLFGAQDAYTVYPVLLGLAVHFLGLNVALILAVFAGACVTLLGAFRLSKAVGLREFSWLYVSLIAGVPLSYHFHVGEGFSIGEAYATPRALSIGASLYALAFRLERREIAAWVVHVFAVAVHPLLGGWALLVAVLLRCRESIVLLLWLVTASLLLALATLDIPWPFLKPISGAWLEVLQRHPGVALIPDPLFASSSSALFWYGLLLFGGYYGAPTLRPYYWIALLVAASAFLAGHLITEYAPRAGLVRLQLWRANWLAVAFGCLACVDLIRNVRLRDSSIGEQFRHAALCAVIALSALIGGALIVALVLACRLGGSRLRERLENLASPWKLAALLIGAVFLLVISLYPDVQMAGRANLADRQLFVFAEDAEPFLEFAIGLLRTGGFGLIPLVLWLFVSRYLRSCTLHLVLAGCVFMLSSAVWDLRTHQRRLDERGYLSNDAKFSANVAIKGSVVHWPGEADRVWFDIGTAVYADYKQLAGGVFSEARVLEVDRRLQRVETARAMSRFLPTDEVAEYLCADPELDIAILPQAIKQKDVAQIQMFDCHLPRRAHAGVDKD